jgi:predicted ATP-binding protein involved in virulence
MHLCAQIFQDARGRRSAQTSLRLDGPGAQPIDPEALKASPHRPVDTEPKTPGGTNRVLAQLDVLAPDSLDHELFGELVSSRMREDLTRAAGRWTKHEDAVAARFLQANGLTAEQDAILQQLIETAQVRLRRRREQTTVRVLRLDLTDFRGIEQLTLALSAKQTSVLVGVNGSGKTTLLDATALLLSHLESGITRSVRRARALTDADVMNGRDLTRVAITAAIAGNPVTWSLAHARGGEPLPPQERSGLFSLGEEVAGIHREIDRGDVHLPIAVFYPVNRVVLDIPLRIRTPHLFEPLEAYDGALVGDRRNFRLFFEWFRGREDLENEYRIQDSSYRDPQLEAVRRALESLMPGFTGLRVQRAPLGMVVTKGAWTLYVDQLSDGEKCLLAMAGDLARRLAMANPFLDDPLQGSGVVLIDEIELHLHPGWQREVVPALERTFPGCQFILSTHSPAILGHLEPESVFLIKQGAGATTAVNPSVSRGMDANRVLLEIMGVDERPHDIKLRLELIYTLLGAGKLAEAAAAIAALEADIGSDPELAKAAVILRRKEILGR